MPPNPALIGHYLIGLVGLKTITLVVSRMTVMIRMIVDLVIVSE